MRTSRLSVLRKRDEKGAALLEFALVFGLFVFVLYALIAFGMILSTKNSITHAAAEGARSAIGVTDDPATTGVDERVAAAKAKVANSLDWLGAKYVPSDSPDPTIAHCVGSASPTAQCITVKVIYPYETRPLVVAPGMDLITPKTFSATAVVELTP